MVDETKIIEKVMEEATLKFLKNAKSDSLACSKCYSIMWITKDYCPDCDKAYPSTMENRLARHKYIFDTYLGNELRKLGHCIEISREI